MLHHKRSPGVQAPARVRGRCAGLGCAPARPGSARCAGEQVWLIPCCKLLANREFKLAAPSQHRRQPGRGGAGSCRGNPANLGAGCSPPPHALSGKPCPAATGLARVRQPRRIKQIVPARASASSAQITHSGALFTNGPQIPLTVHIGGSRASGPAVWVWAASLAISGSAWPDGWAKRVNRYPRPGRCWDDRLRPRAGGRAGAGSRRAGVNALRGWLVSV